MGVFEDLSATELRDELHRQGFDDVVRIVEDLHEFDPSKLRLLAEQVYGTSHGGSLGVGTVVPDRLAKLVELSEEQRRSSLDERWGGPAYENFVAYMQEVETDLAREEDRMRLLGDALLQAADIFDQASDDFASAISIGSSTYGVYKMFMAARTALFLSVGSVIGTVTSTATLAYEANRSVTAQCRDIAEAAAAMRSLRESRGTEFGGASSLIEGISRALDETATSGTWNQETTDPYT